jgi:hypothetical protein
VYPADSCITTIIGKAPTIKLLSAIAAVLTTPRFSNMLKTEAAGVISFMDAL